MTDRFTFAGKIEPEGRRLRGSITLAGSRTFRDGEYVQVDPRALMKADASNVLATIDHDPSKMVGRTFNKTLAVSRTEDGISFETAELPNTSYANDALELAKGGYYGGASFTVEGIRSKFDTDPETGLRVRTINSIKRLVDVAVVMDPAFDTSSAAAFSKETPQMTDEPNPTPEPEPTPEPPATFKEQPKSGSDEWAAFARDITTDQITAQMDAIFASAKGNMTGDLLDRYEGFAKVLDERKKASTQDKARIERMEALHNLRLGRVPQAPQADAFATDEAKAMFNAYLRGDSREWEQFAQSIAGDGTQGGYMVPDGFLNRITETQLAYGGIAGVADTITTTTGQPLRWPSNDDTGNSAVIAAEGSAAGSGGADKVFGSIELGAYSYDATGASNLPLLVSKELLQDAAFDVEAFIGRNLGTRLGRKMAADFATGSGSGEPKGLLDKTPDVMSATTMFAAVIEHMFQVDAAYRDAGNCRWVLSDTTLAKAYASVDGNGRPLFIAASDASAASRPTGFIMGYPVTIDNGAGNLVAFGDIRQGYIIRYVRGVQVDVDPYTNIKSRQVAYHAWARADANIQDSAAVSVSDYTGVSADS